MCLITFPKNSLHVVLVDHIWEETYWNYSEGKSMLQIKPCRDAGVRAVCYYYYAPCGNSTDFSPPQALCQDVCEKLTTGVCPDEWQLTLDYTTQLSDFLTQFQLQFVACNDTGLHLGSIPHCCSDAGITFGKCIII